MNINYTSNLIEILFLLLGWSIIAYLAYKIQKKQVEKIKVWKIFVIIYIGLFCFSFNYMIDMELIRIPLLPLGVWILYFIWRNNQSKWEKYRRFAWLGFWSNFLFVALSVLAIFIHPLIYGKDDLSTFIAKLEDPRVISIHLDVEEEIFDEQNFLSNVSTYTPDSFYTDEWYNETFTTYEGNVNEELFPYILEGTVGKWGSGMKSTIYIEKDGKGIFVSSSKGQYYFRSDVSVFKEVD